MMAVNSLTPNMPRFDTLQKEAEQHSTYIQPVSDSAPSVTFTAVQWTSHGTGLSLKQFRVLVSVEMQP